RNGRRLAVVGSRAPALGALPTGGCPVTLATTIGLAEISAPHHDRPPAPATNAQIPLRAPVDLPIYLRNGATSRENPGAATRAAFAAGLPAQSPLVDAGERVLQDLGPLAEREPHLRAPGVGIVVEHGVGDRDHAGLVRQIPAELHAVGVAEPPDIGGDEIGAVRRGDQEASLRKACPGQGT